MFFLGRCIASRLRCIATGASKDVATWFLPTISLVYFITESLKPHQASLKMIRDRQFISHFHYTNLSQHSIWTNALTVVCRFNGCAYVLSNPNRIVIVWVLLLTSTTLNIQSKRVKFWVIRCFNGWLFTEMCYTLRRHYHIRLW